MQYLIVIEKAETGYSTCEEVEQNMREAVEFHRILL